MKPNFLDELSHGLQSWLECNECENTFGYLSDDIDEEPEYCPMCGVKGELTEHRLLYSDSELGLDDDQF